MAQNGAAGLEGAMGTTGNPFIIKPLLIVVMFGSVFTVCFAATEACEEGGNCPSTRIEKGRSMIQMRQQRTSTNLVAGTVEWRARHDINREKFAQPNPTSLINFEKIDIEDYGHIEDGDQDYNGMLGYLKESSTAAPGLLIIPGKGGEKERHKQWIYMFAGRGIASLAVDMVPPNAADQKEEITKAVEYMKSDACPASIDPDDISLMGYSNGGAIIAKYIAEGWDGFQAFKNFITIAGLRKDDGEAVIEGNLMSGKGFLAVQCEDDPNMGKLNGVAGFVTSVSAKGAFSHAICYSSGEHRPVINTNFYYEVTSFINDPSSFVDFSSCVSEGNKKGENGMVELNWADTYSSEGDIYACYSRKKKERTNMDGLEFNVWARNNGELACQGYCLQTENCNAYEFLTEALGTDKKNCILYETPCENPELENDHPPKRIA